MRTRDESKNNAIESSSRRINLRRIFSAKKKIVVADDDPAVRDVFMMIFEEAGYDVETIKDGNALLKNNFSKPDLFLIDKLLSGVNGLDVCRQLKEQKATRHIPVVMISASPGIAVQSREAGADDYIEKPFDRNYLLAVIERNISPKEIKPYISKIGIICHLCQ